MAITAIQSKIGAQDIRWRSGNTSDTFTRLTSAGGTYTLNEVGNCVDVYHAYGSNLTAITDAISNIGSNQIAIELAPGTWQVSADLTIPSNISLLLPKGAILEIATTKTLTINGYLEAGRWQCFSCVGTGKVVVKSGQDLFPEWWGAVGDDTGTGDGTDNATALQACIIASDASNAWVDFLPLKYRVATFATDGLTYPFGGVMRTTHWACSVLSAKLKGNGATIIIDSTPGVTPVQSFLRTTKTTKIENLTFDFINRTSGFCGTAIWLKGVSGTPVTGYVRDCSFLGGFYHVCLYDYVQDFDIRDNIHNHGSQVSYGSTAVWGEDCRDMKRITVDNLDVTAGTNVDGIEFNCDGTGSYTGRYDTNKVPREATEWNEDITVMNCKIRDAVGDIDSSNIGIGFAGPVKNLRIINNTVSNCRLPIHHEYGGTYSGGKWPENCVISGNIVPSMVGLSGDTTPAIDITTSGGSSTHPFDVENYQVLDNHITLTQAAYTPAGIVLWGGSYKVDGNVICVDQSAETRPELDYSGRIGIRTYEVDRAFISNNDIRQCNAGISFGGNAANNRSNTEVFGNVFTNCETDYYLEESTVHASGTIAIHDNHHNGCYEIYDCGSAINLAAQNEWLNGARFDLMILKPATTAIHFGIEYGYRNWIADFDVLADITGSGTGSQTFGNLNNDLWWPGSRIINVRAAGTNQTLSITDYGAIEPVVDTQDVSSTADSNILTYTGTLNDVYAPGQFIELAGGETFHGVGYATIYWIDTVNKKIYVHQDADNTATVAMTRKIVSLAVL